MIEKMKRSCSSILLLLFHTLLLSQTGHTLFAVAAKSKNEVTPPNDISNATTVSELELKDCPTYWTCKDYDRHRQKTNDRGHYRDINCACDELCVLLEDCCPDAHEFWPKENSSSGSAPDAAHGAPPASDNSRESGNPSTLEKVSSRGTKTFRGVNSKPRKNGARANSKPRATFKGGNAAKVSRKSGKRRGRVTSTSSSDPSSSSSGNNDRGLAFPADNRDLLYVRYKLTKGMFSCVYDTGINTANRVSLVSRCPRLYKEDPQVRDLCHNVSDDDMMTRLPVSGTVTRVLYRNMFCALCHQEPFVYWTAGVDCSSWSRLPYNENSTLADVQLNSSDCRVSFRPPADRYGWRPCRANVKRRCSKTFPLNTTLNKQIAERCETSKDSVQRMVYTSTRAYWNQFCGLCDHNLVDSLSCQPLSLDTSIDQAATNTRSRAFYSFSILLDINTNTGSTTVGQRNDRQVMQRNESVSCGRGRVYDPFQSACRPVTCGPGRYFVGNACAKIEATTDEKGANRDVALLNITSTHAPLHEMSNCSYIELNDTEFQILNNGTLKLLGADLIFDDSQFVISDGDVFLCVNYSQNYTDAVTREVDSASFAFSFAEAVVSTCGICLSLLAMAATVFVYASIRHLQNIPGQNLLSLVSALFLADALLLVAPSAGGWGGTSACAVIAGLMHYFFLASFVWMNVMAVDVWFTFSRAFVKAGDRGKSSKRFAVYSCYAWLTPAVFVVPAVLLQVLDPDSSLSPNYGMGICWVSNKDALLLFFAAPLSFLLLLNVVLFIISARNISRASRSSARMLGKEEDSKMGIYVKLTVIMGITWILGFLAALVPSNKILTYSFVVMNTLQGLFICVSFVFTKKVLRLLKDKFGVGFRTKFRVTKSGSTHLTNVSSSSNRKLSSCSAKMSQNVVL